jgi:hypothetical protein
VLEMGQLVNVHAGERAIFPHHGIDHAPVSFTFGTMYLLKTHAADIIGIASEARMVFAVLRGFAISERSRLERRNRGCCPSLNRDVTGAHEHTKKVPLASRNPSSLYNLSAGTYLSSFSQKVSLFLIKI